MRSSIDIPLVVKNVKLTGPAGSISVDMILDTGAGISAVNWPVPGFPGFFTYSGVVFCDFRAWKPHFLLIFTVFSPFF
jgi:hypothetical protein